MAAERPLPTLSIRNLPDESEEEMYETMRMLAQDHEADLEREAAKRRRAASARADRSSPPPADVTPRRRWATIRSRLAALVH